MRKVEIELYSFDELREDVRSELIESERYGIMDRRMEIDMLDYRDVRERMEALMNVTWTGGDNYRFDLEGDEPMGKSLWRYIEYNVIPYIVSGRMFYHGGKKRRSRVLMDDPLSSYPLSGLWLDGVALEPVMRFRHDWWLGKYPEDYSLTELFKECVDALWDDYRESGDYYSSDEYVMEEMRNEGECFTYDGERMAI